MGKLIEIEQRMNKYKLKKEIGSTGGVYGASEYKQDMDELSKHFPADIECLLSVIKQAEKDLVRISDLHIRSIEDRAAEPHREIAREALKCLRQEIS